MTMTTDTLIEELTQDLEPVRPLRPRFGLALIALAVATTAAAVLYRYGLRSGLESGSFSVFFPLANGLLLLLGIAAASSTVAMANPRVGGRHEGVRWAIAMAAILPLTAIALLAANRFEGAITVGLMAGRHCFAEALIYALLPGLALLWWLRRGAPVALHKAGLHLGVAAGALGSAAYGISCPADSLYHLGVWHFLPVLVTGIVGTIVVPPLVRW